MIALTVAPEHASVLRDIDVGTMPNGRTFEPLELVVEAGDSFLLALPTNSKFSEKIRSIWIKKDFVESALYLRELALHFEGYYAERSPLPLTPTSTERPSGANTAGPIESSP